MKLSGWLAAAACVLARALEPACDLSVPEFAGFLLRVRVAYNYGVFELGDVERVNRFLDRRRELLTVCPVAVLQAILLKLEENLIYEPRAYEELMATYVHYLQAAISKGSLNAADLEQWPLAEGVERTSAVSGALAEPRNLSSAMVMNFCKAADRFGELHELTWLLEPPFGSPADGPDRGLLQQTDLFIYLVDKPWCSRPSELVLHKIRRAVRQLFIVPYVGGPQREEQTAYFKFLADHYDNLHDFVIFVHPDAPEHQGDEFLALRRALRLLHSHSRFAWESVGYFPLANQMVVDPKRTWGKKFAKSWHHFYVRVFGEPWSSTGFEPPRCYWKSYPGAYISAYAPGGEERQSRSGAKAACVASAQCSGITCNTPLESEEMSDELFLSPHLGRATCTARLGDPPGLYESPEGKETSYVKVCAGDEGETAHDDGFWLDPAGRAEAERTGAEEAGPRVGRPPRPPAEGAGPLFQFYTGSQSVVRKDRLLAWPREQYEQWAADGQFCSDYTGLLEAVWHAMFGEPLSQYSRESDPRTPIYLKWGLGSMYSYGDEGTI